MIREPILTFDTLRARVTIVSETAESTRCIEDGWVWDIIETSEGETIYQLKLKNDMSRSVTQMTQAYCRREDVLALTPENVHRDVQREPVIRACDLCGSEPAITMLPMHEDRANAYCMNCWRKEHKGGEP